MTTTTRPSPPARQKGSDFWRVERFGGTWWLLDPLDSGLYKQKKAVLDWSFPQAVPTQAIRARRAVHITADCMTHVSLTALPSATALFSHISMQLSPNLRGWFGEVIVYL